MLKEKQAFCNKTICRITSLHPILKGYYHNNYPGAGQSMGLGNYSGFTSIKVKHKGNIF